MKFSYEWKLSDLQEVEKNNLKVFSTFCCGGGSTMGYKMAGCEVVAGCDIDPRMAKVYALNHKPKKFFLKSISELTDADLEPFKGIDILDGSPPCSTFSMAGSREKAFKMEKRFKEGQAKQILSDLFFDFLNVAERLQPKVIIAENVKGMLSGNAKAYTHQVLKRFNEIGYDVQLFCLNGASMGLPQARERVFFVAGRKDLKFPKIKMQFNEKPVVFGKIKHDQKESKTLEPSALSIWKLRKLQDKSLRDTRRRVGMSNALFTYSYIFENQVMRTIIADDKNILFNEPRRLNNVEYCRAGSFPSDYNFGNIQPKYLIGMSVPPLMMARVANEVVKQWFKL